MEGGAFINQPGQRLQNSLECGGWVNYERVGQRAFSSCNLLSASLRLSGEERDRLKAQNPRRYLPWHHVGHCNSLSRRAKWSEEYFLISLITTISKRHQSISKMSSHLARNNQPCCTCHHVFRWRNHQRCQKWRMRFNRPNSIRRSGTCWL